MRDSIKPLWKLEVHSFTSSGLWLEGLFHALSYQHRTCIGITHICHSSCSPIWHRHICFSLLLFSSLLQSVNLSPFFFTINCVQETTTKWNVLCSFVPLLDKKKPRLEGWQEKGSDDSFNNPPPISSCISLLVRSLIKFSMCSHQVPNVFPPCSHNPTYF